MICMKRIVTGSPLDTWWCLTASYYTSFASVGLVVYFLRTRRGYRSLPEAINERYGSLATVSFCLAVLFRLYQEVWSNALVVAGFYGDTVCWPSLNSSAWAALIGLSD